ncbi:MAG: site-2 protease family protein [Parcubacteria group bacterium]|nr:site-2 protease family protein [Parcubacteria group bacterium]
MTAFLIIVILIFSIIIHEVGHGVAALMFGDTTARDRGRLTLNPLAHIDPLGSIVVPAILLLMKSPFLFGWAKPVPFCEENLYPKRLGILCVTLGGVIVNFIVAIGCGLVLRFSASSNLLDTMPILLQVLALITFINLLLGIFNLLPIPPLDGHRLFTVWLPDEWRAKIEMYSIVLLPLIIFVLIKLPVLPVVFAVFKWLTGVSIQP